MTGLISNAWNDLRPFLEREKLTDTFDPIVISAEIGRAKPDPEIYHLALKQAQVLPNEAVFVDDSPVNIEGSEKVGMQGILFKETQKTITQLKALL
jgi:HAD superfamily hydrolase (TIGR01509 family)